MAKTFSASNITKGDVDKLVQAAIDGSPAFGDKVTKTKPLIKKGKEQTKKAKNTEFATTDPLVVTGKSVRLIAKPVSQDREVVVVLKGRKSGATKRITITIKKGDKKNVKPIQDFDFKGTTPFISTPKPDTGTLEDKSKDFSMLSNDEQVKQEKQVLQQKQAEADQLIQQLETMKEQGIDKTSVPPEFGGTKDDGVDDGVLNMEK